MVIERDRLLPPSERLIVALDEADATTALDMVRRLEGLVSRFKVGLQLFCSAGPGIVERLAQRGVQVFLDLKLHDIPNTVRGALEACVQPGVFLVNVHAAGGRAMLLAAAEAVRGRAEHLGIPAPQLLGVTMLTHLHEADLEEVGFAEKSTVLVPRLARVCLDAGLDGVVASPREVRVIRAETGFSFVIVTPGIRPQGTEEDDQARTDTPTRALRAGASYLVVGRPITRAADPVKAAQTIMREMEDAFLIA